MIGKMFHLFLLHNFLKQGDYSTAFLFNFILEYAAKKVQGKQEGI